MDKHSKEKNEMNINEIEEKATDVEEIIQSDSSETDKLKNQIADLQDQLLRLLAESDNTRKRLEKLRDEAHDYAIVSFAKDLLSVSDNLSRALEYKPSNLDKETSNIIMGVEMTQAELARIFKAHKIEIIEPLIGTKFDYNMHQAISQIETTEYDNDSIVTVMQIGYKIKDRLLRPATVQVAKKVK